MAQRQGESPAEIPREGPGSVRLLSRSTAVVRERGYSYSKHRRDDGVQALERITATLPMQPDRVEQREFEYERHGTLTLIANFHVVTGELVALTVGPTRTEENFVAHVVQTVATDPGRRGFSWWIS